MYIRSVGDVAVKTVVQHLTSGRLLAQNAVWNLSGMAIPMLVALFAIPLLIDGMGKERFGLLAIIWMGVGYFSLFDLGVGRALTKLISERLGQERSSDLGSLIWSAFILLVFLGILGTLLLSVFSQYLVAGLLNAPNSLHEEGVSAFRLLAAGLPVVIVTAGLVGVLEAHQRFGIITAVRIPLGVVTFIGPLVSLQFTSSIAWATAVLVGARLIALIAYYIAAASFRGELYRPQKPERKQIRYLLSFGGWLTVTNIVGPLMTYMDRFFIGTLLSLSAVAYYVTPYEVLSRLQMLPRSIMGVLFPAMAAAHGASRKRLTQLFAISSKVTYWSMLPITASTFLMAPEALQVWLGKDFQNASTPVVHWLAAGWIMSTLARPAFTVLQSTGRPDLVAKAHLVELGPYLGLLWWLTDNYGIAGAAAAWMVRVLADTIILNVIVASTLPVLRKLVTRTYATVLVTSLGFMSFWLMESLLSRLLVVVLLVIVASAVLLNIARPLLRSCAKPVQSIEMQRWREKEM